MGRDYYYFAASLPVLAFDSPAPMSREEFLADCKRLLAPEDYEDAKVAVMDMLGEMPVRNPLLAQWQKLIRSFNNELAFHRATEAGKDPFSYLRGERSFETCVLEALSAVEKSADPLSAEKVLDQMRFQCAQDLGQGHMYDVEAILIYGIQLSIVARYDDIHSSQGKEMLDGYKKAALEIN